MTAISALLRFKNVAQFESNWCFGPVPFGPTISLQKGKPFQVKGHRFAIEVRGSRYHVRDLKADSFFDAIRKFFTFIGRAATRRQLQAIVGRVVAEPVCSIPIGPPLGYPCIDESGIPSMKRPWIGFPGDLSQLFASGTVAPLQREEVPPCADGTLTILRQVPAEPQLSPHSFPAHQYIGDTPSAPPYEGNDASLHSVNLAPSAPPYEAELASCPYVDLVPSAPPYEESEAPQPGAGRPPGGRLYPSLEEYGFKDGTEDGVPCAGNAGWLPGWGPSS
ncbi:hypothetical protein CURE108131_06970 [Cupriavidus respiraculi]|uniref:Uncharacterized protein n=1 Tax=Cupriavidus respiraculi TaxID=195930 RepID=A0ABM8X9M6_9BURK|nr:hypothetical protein [Cupriavidus respiraculi]CAG9176699.1 hypothetical protein LMG21510_03099 [Cupriavidus respiraculi]